jgi:hypothetical protein
MLFKGLQMERDGFCEMIRSPAALYLFLEVSTTPSCQGDLLFDFVFKRFPDWVFCVTHYLILHPTQVSLSSLKFNMSLYPHLSKPDRRICSYKENIVCPSFPCPHTSCHDPDWLEDHEERHWNQGANDKAWDLYKSLYGQSPSSTLKDQLSAGEWAFYEPKVDRCRRLDNKRVQIAEEIRARDMLHLEKCRREQEEVLNDPSLQHFDIIIHRKERRRRGILEPRLVK